MKPAVRIAIIGKNEIVREGLRRILIERDFSVVHAVSSCAALRTATADHQHDVNMIIVDSTSHAEGQATCRQLREAFAASRIVLLGEDFSVQTTSEAMSVGVDGYLAKEISCEPLARSLELIASGEKVMPSQMVAAMMETEWRQSPDDWMATANDVHLSEREIEVLRCLTRGGANKTISRELAITEATVKVHIKAIMRKLSVMNRTQAAIWAVSRGVAEAPHRMRRPGSAYQPRD
jgi:two-component system, NarL family, nitrate/nitrite response regulator NarL